MLVIDYKFQYLFADKPNLKLERITKEKILEFITANDIELDCKQARLCVPIIDRLYRKMLVGVRFTEIGVDDNLICDGHHRYLASLLAQYPISRKPAIKTSADIIVPWMSVEYDEFDWDTALKIRMLNEQDALYNDIALERLLELLK